VGDPVLRIHAFLPRSYANGPGARAVVWVQGCSLGCPGCFNPATHPFRGGGRMLPVELLKRVVALGDCVEGITLTGGEPLQQRRGVSTFLQRLRAETSLSVVLFTGYTWEEAARMEAGAPSQGRSGVGGARVLPYVDVLIAGRYDASQRVARSLVGSANQTVHYLTDRYSPADLEAVPPAEAIITSAGELVLSGVNPLT
jgi:anaerobic ribonucleoside-triphosphate reductase activating protein